MFESITEKSMKSRRIKLTERQLRELVSIANQKTFFENSSKTAEIAVAAKENAGESKNISNVIGTIKDDWPEVPSSLKGVMWELIKSIMNDVKTSSDLAKLTKVAGIPLAKAEINAEKKADGKENNEKSDEKKDDKEKRSPKEIAAILN